MMIESAQLLEYGVRCSAYYLAAVASVLLFVYLECYATPRTDVTFQTSNKAIAKSFVASEMLTGAQCMVLVSLLPFAVLCWCCFAGKQLRMSSSWTCRVPRPEWLPATYHMWHVSCICLVLVLGVNGVLTNALKLWISNFRPDFLDRCQLAAQAEPLEWYSVQMCQQTDKALLYEGLKSTPSGHSSFVAAGIGFAYLWQCRFLTVDKKRHIWCPVLCVVVMVSRVVDHRHHWYDVLSGGLLGALVCYAVLANVFVKPKSVSVLPL